ncbi:MAG: acyl dehydratase [Clostridiales bacterium]|jgi:acyl dehydratase|nr:acyl dehydratase [Clostridiales bacterium]
MYFEELKIGQQFQIKPVTITLEDIYEFANKYDPLPIHTDPKFAQESIYEGIIASGFHTLCAVWGQWVRSNIVGKEVIGGLGIDFLNWTAPVRPNDQLSADIEVVDLIPSSKGGRGLLVAKATAYNQNRQIVLVAQVKGLIKSKP